MCIDYFVTYGGTWVPPGKDCIMTDESEEMYVYLMEHALEIIFNWVLSCHNANPKIERGHRVLESPLLPEIVHNGDIGFRMYEVDQIDLPRNAECVRDLFGCKQCRLMLPVDFDEAFFRRPPHFTKVNRDSVQYVEQYWEIYRWMHEGSAKRIFGKLPRLDPPMLHLAKQRLGMTPHTFLPISARFAQFINDAITHGLQKEATALACILEHNAATFSPEVAIDGTGLHESHPPLLVLSYVLFDVEKFLHQVRQADRQKGKSFVQLHIGVGKLRSAGRLFEKLMEILLPINTRSDRSPAEKSVILAHCLAAAVPEYVAYNHADKWFASGIRLFRK